VVERKVIEARVFLVGCPRSGTTLLQSLLAAHSRVTSFPETHFLSGLRPSKTPYRALGLASRAAMRRLETFRDELGRQPPRWPAWWERLLARTMFGAFVRMLDGLALEAGASAWVEKTPNHLRYVDEIERHLPSAKVLHIVRNGPETVLSLYRTTRDHPERWGGSWTLERCVERWNESVRLTAAHAGKPHHHVVRYERLLEDPQPVLQRVCGFLGIPYEAGMLARRAEAAQRVVAPWEEWKGGVFERVADTTESRREAFERELDPDQRAYVAEHLVSLEASGLAR
jgi:hypothetical protein